MGLNALETECVAYAARELPETLTLASPVPARLSLIRMARDALEGVGGDVPSLASPMDVKAAIQLGKAARAWMEALERAESLRNKAREHQVDRDLLLGRALVIEKANGINPPCHLCGRRVGCSH